MRIPDSYLLSAEEAARRMGVSPSTVYRMIQRYEIEYVRIGRLLRIRPQAVDDYLRKQTITSR